MKFGGFPMKHRTLIALALAGALTIPALAQTSSSQTQSTAPAATDQQNSSSQNSSTPQSTTDDQQAAKDNAATATQKQPLSYERHEGFWGHMMPFARKKYVQRQLNPVRDRVNELDELTAANSKAIKDVDSRATEGIRLASLKANEADQHAVDAGNRARMAQDTAAQASTHLQSVEKVVTNIDQFQPVSETEILFRPGQRALSKKAKDALDDMATPLKDQKGYIVEVQGFSSGKGQAAIANSQAMAESVVRYLVLTHDIPVYRIYTVGMGNAPVEQANADGTKPRRVSGGRVEISLLKNGIGDLNGAQASAPTATNQEPNQQPQESTPR
jgi:outer membrane protein OmpA-like peptidoglycan-associated protein